MWAKMKSPHVVKSGKGLTPSHPLFAATGEPEYNQKLGNFTHTWQT